MLTHVETILLLLCVCGLVDGGGEVIDQYSANIWEL